MSKGLGQKIVIKFTEDLVGDVSGKGTATPYSFYRWYITSTWSSSGRLYLYELEFFSDGIKVNTNKIISMAGSSRYSSNYDVDRLFDGSVPGTEWDANGSLPHWVSIELDEAVAIDSFRWHTGTSSNKPKEFILQGSNDGINWVDIYTGESPNLNNWIDFAVTGAGNEIAFTVTGQEYQYVNGPMIDKEYRVVKVERYGIVPIWRLGDSVALDTLGEVEIIDTNAIQIASDTSASLSVNAEAGDIVLATVSLRSSSTVPTGWTEIYRSEVGGSNQYLVLATKEVVSDGLVTYTATQSSPGRIMINLITIRNAKVKHAPEFTVVGNFTGEVSVPNKQVGEKLIWCMSANIWLNTGYNSWKTSPDDLQLVDFVSEDPPPRQANFIDLGEGEATGRKFIPGVTSETNVFITAVKLLEEVDSYKVVEISPIKITGQYRVRWQEDKPTGTDITIEYTTGTVQGEWLEVSNGEVITSDTNMWFRITLETTDTSVTPTLQDLWLEEPEAPNDQIRLVMHPQGRFNNVEGSLTVQYDQSKGSLRGRGGIVEGFTETFMPTDLEPKPNPHVAENIEVSAEANVSFTKVIYNQRYADEQITASATVTVDFIYVGIINP